MKGELVVSRETIDRIIRFENVFRKWSKKINLVASSTSDDVWRRHVEDSAQLYLLAPGMQNVIDIGSGGGFPGIILAAILEGVDNSQITLVESNHKKAAFLQAARQACAPKARIVTGRIEDKLPKLKVPDYVTARALAPLPKLLGLTSSALSKGAVGLFHKGRGFRDELKESHANWEFDLIEHESRIDSDSVILEIRNLMRRD